MYSLWLNILITITILVTNISNTQSTSCNSLTTQSTCEGTINCKWITTPPTQSTVQCVCASENELDILIGIDGSGSIENAPFQIQKQFIAELVTQTISNTQRIGFTMFATNVNILSNIQLWNNYQTLYDFVMNINYPTGYTNTAGLLDSAETQFANISEPADREKILLIITDGRPCVSGHCPQTVCQYEYDIKVAGIRVIIVGVGDSWDSTYVACLTLTPADIHYVAAFTSGDFDTISGDLSADLCPSIPTNEPTNDPTNDPTNGSKYLIVDGAWNNNQNNKHPECHLSSHTDSYKTNDYGTKIGVRCCNGDAINAVGSTPSECAKGVSWDYANNLCESTGLQLCTREQIEYIDSETGLNTGRKTGCGFDGYSIWTATPCDDNYVYECKDESGSPYNRYYNNNNYNSLLEYIIIALLIVNIISFAYIFMSKCKNKGHNDYIGVKTKDNNED